MDQDLFTEHKEPIYKARWCIGGDWNNFAVYTQYRPNPFYMFMMKWCLDIWWEEI